MSKIIELLNELNTCSTEIELNDFSEITEDLTILNFKFRNINFSISNYYCEHYSQVVYNLIMYTKKGSLVFSTTDNDLQGYVMNFIQIQTKILLKIGEINARN